jgi:hypothetical protein
MSNTPFILSDNFFDDAVLHPTHVVTTSGTEVAGMELFNIADNLRDGTAGFSVAEGNTAISITVDAGAAKSADTIIFDVGHNLTGASVQVRGSTDNFAASDVLVATFTIPSSAGGLGSAGCLTPKGVAWMRFAPASYCFWRVVFPPLGQVVEEDMVFAIAPRLGNVHLGQSYRFPTYLDGPASYDYRTQHKVLKNEVSQTGIRVKRGIINWDEVNLSVRLEEADFQQLHPHVRRLLDYNHVWWFSLDDSTTEGSGLMRLFQLPGDTLYDPTCDPVHRKVAFLLEEVAPVRMSA